MTLYVCERHHVFEADEKPPCCLAEHRPDINLRVTCGAPILGPVATDGARILPPGQVEIDGRVWREWDGSPIDRRLLRTFHLVPVEGEPEGGAR